METLGARFNFVGVIPGTTLVAFLAALLLSGAPNESPSADRLASAVSALDALDVTVLVALAVLFALILHPLLYPLIQALEGYWPPVGPFGVAVELGRRRHLARKRALYAQGTSIQPHGWWETRFPYLKERRRVHASAAYAAFPEDEWIMPTRLGNVLRHAERLAGDRYGLTAIEVIPRLYPLMPPTMTRVVDDARTELDIAVSFIFVWLTATTVSFVILAPHGPWLVVPLLTYGLAWLSYRGAISAARYYGATIVWAIDLYRFALLEQLRIPLPKTHSEELQHNPELHKLLAGHWLRRKDGAARLKVGAYEHPESAWLVASPHRTGQRAEPER
jgi:hypothetical protein